MGQSIKEIVQFASDLGIVGMLILILVGGYRKWWVWGYQLDDLKKDGAIRCEELRRDRDEWKSFALRGTVMAERATTLAETVKISPLRLEGS